jgi:hypothetical protein
MFSFPALIAKKFNCQIEASSSLKQLISANSVQSPYLKIQENQDPMLFLFFQFFYIFVSLPCSGAEKNSI